MSSTGGGSVTVDPTGGSSFFYNGQWVGTSTGWTYDPATGYWRKLDRSSGFELRAPDPSRQEGGGEKIVDPDVHIPYPVPGGTPITAVPVTANSAREELRRLLKAFGLEELADVAYEFYLAGITDIDQIMVELEDSEAFRARFPGYRDDRTGEVLLPVREYLGYEQSLQSLAAAYGLPFFSRAEMGAMIQSRRSLVEVKEDLDAYNALRDSPFIKQQFFAYTGYMASDEELFGLVLGLAPDLESRYNKAVEAGVSSAEFFSRLTGDIDAPTAIEERERRLAFLNQQLTGTLSPEQQAAYTQEIATIEEQLRNLNTYGNISAPTVGGLDLAMEAEGEFVSPEDRINRYERMRALRLAIASERSRFKEGGQALVGEPRFERPRLRDAF